MGVVVTRFDVYLVHLDPTVGSEIRKARPCVVVSPDSLNNRLRTVIIAPMTTKSWGYPSRVDCMFGGREGNVALDQIRTVDRLRLVKKLGRLDDDTGERVLSMLREVFAS